MRKNICNIWTQVNFVNIWSFLKSQWKEIIPEEKQIKGTNKQLTNKNINEQNTWKNI